jgi:hypothetical protein
VLAVLEDTLLIMAPDGRYGWSHRVWWEKAGEEQQTYERIEGSDAAG